MLNTLYSKLVVVLAGFCLAMEAMFVMVMRISHDTYHLEANQRLNHDLAGQLARESGFGTSELVPSALGPALQRITRMNPDIDVYLLADDGAILTSSGAPPAMARIATEPVRQFVKGSSQLPILGDDPHQPSRQKIFSAAPVRLAGNTPGYLYVVLGGQARDSIVESLERNYVLRDGVVLSTAGLVFALLAALFILRLLTRPLHQLTAAVTRFREGGFIESPRPYLPSPRKGQDEIERLTVAFGEMADRIVEQMQALKLTDATRRELVTNISHDLRTPLASIHAHLEALYHQGAKLSDDEKKSYIEAALKQSRSLGRLVERFFELAKLEGDRTPVSPEPFALPDLVQDVVQKFSLTAENKRIALHAMFTDDLPLVFADVGLIEEVFENLLENALRFTPEGGGISIALVPENARIAVRVSDTGQGIAAEQLPRIFDRFYRGDRSRSAPAGRAGLGLAIVKRILELHGSNIAVESAPGAGTTFYFTLPLHVREPTASTDSSQGWPKK